MYTQRVHCIFFQPIPSYHDVTTTGRSSTRLKSSYSPSKVALLSQDYTSSGGGGGGDIPLQDTVSYIVYICTVEPLCNGHHRYQ